MKDEVISVALVDLIDVLETRTKMKRAPAGARSVGLREVAIIPGREAVTFEMPGFSQRVAVLEGKLIQEVIFPTTHLLALITLLKGYIDQEKTVRIEVSITQVSDVSTCWTDLSI